MTSWLAPLERERQALYAVRVFRAGGYRATDVLLDLTEAHVPLPPDWSDGYTSIFDVQQTGEG